MKRNALARTLERVEELQEQVRDLEREKAALREALEFYGSPAPLFPPGTPGTARRLAAPSAGPAGWLPRSPRSRPRRR